MICILLAALILCTAAYLRLHSLDERPLHFDEATGARIVGYNLDQKRAFDPKHFHGPLLSTLAVPVARTAGQSDWLTLTITPLRSVTAAAGFLTVAICLLFPARWSLTLTAAALVATSPLLVYYSRMYIHEPLFVFCGILTLLTLAKFCESHQWIWALACGLCIGLMAATRETALLALFSWVTAGFLVALQASPKTPWKKYLITAFDTVKALRWKIIASMGCCLMVIYLFYSHFGQNHTGFIDFFRTYFVYETTPGHEKAWNYYLNLLIIPQQAMGVIWTEASILILAVAGYFLAPQGRPRLACRFVMTSGLLLFLIFSLISYKTPWLICLAWLQICIAGGFGLAALSHFMPGKSMVLATILVGTVLIWNTVQAHRAALKWPSDNRNPYTYVPTSPDVVRMSNWLQKLSQQHPEISEKPAVVLGSGYWPLPWYLKDTFETGYYPDIHQVPDLNQTSLLFTTGEIPSIAKQSHQWLPRGLRHEVTLWLGIRNDIWQEYQQHE